MQQEEWPGPDDRPVVEEMLANPDSPHWEKCYRFIQEVVQRTNFPSGIKDDLVQNTMLKVINELPHFQFKGRLAHWLPKIARTTGIDLLRQLNHINRPIQSLTSKDGTEESEFEMFRHHPQHTPEQVFLERDKLRKVIEGMMTYIKAHKNPERNMRLIDLVFFKGKKCEEAAKELNMSPPLAHYIIRSIRRFLEEQNFE